MTASTLTPVTILTGFLGSGKTTLLNRLLRHPGAAGSAVIVNEFGQVGIDHALVRTASGNAVLLPGGCICCQAAGDLVQALRDLYFGRARGEVPDFRRAIIETTGLADPAPLARTLVALPVVAARYCLSGIVAAVDGVHGLRQLDEQPQALKQAAVADRLVLTKTDLAPAARLAAIRVRLAALNPGATILESAMGNADPEGILDTGLHRGGGKVADAGSWLLTGAYRPIGTPLPAGHDPAVRSFAWFAQRPLRWRELEDTLGTLLEVAGERILRLKGLANLEGEEGPVAIHAIQHTLYPAARLGRWPDADRRTRLVFVVRDLEESHVAQMLQSLAAAPGAARAFESARS